MKPALTRTEFKMKWEANEHGSGITFDDIACCAVAWGITHRPFTQSMDVVRYHVLKEANTNDAEEFRPEDDE